MVRNGKANDSDVLVNRIMHPSATLLDTQLAPLRLTQQTIGQAALHLLWQDHMSCISIHTSRVSIAAADERFTRAYCFTVILPTSNRTRSFWVFLIAYLYSWVSSTYFSEYSIRADKSCAMTAAEREKWRDRARVLTHSLLCVDDPFDPAWLLARTRALPPNMSIPRR